MQALEKVPGIHLVNQVIKQKAKKTGGRSAPKGLSGWAKAQMMMIYAIEHDEMWCHKGFLQASEFEMQFGKGMTVVARLTIAIAKPFSTSAMLFAGL